MLLSQVLLTLAWVVYEVHAASLRVVDISTLGQDPQTVNRLNGESFQQDALVTFNGEPITMRTASSMLSRPLGYQYAAFYVDDANNASVRHPSLARRALSGQSTAWESFSLMDYNQTDDDGHDVYVVLGCYLHSDS